jgi:hypothetical protein
VRELGGGAKVGERELREVGVGADQVHLDRVDAGAGQPEAVEQPPQLAALVEAGAQRVHVRRHRRDLDAAKVE